MREFTQRTLRWMYWNLRLYRLPPRLRRRIEERTSARITTRTLEWCRKQSDIAIQSLHPKVVLSIELPRTIEPTLAPEFESHMRYAVEEKYVARMKRTRLIGRDGLVILADGNFAAEIGNGEAGVKEDPAYIQSPYNSCVQKRGNYFSFMMKWSQSGNYYHWMHDILLKAFLVLETLPQDTRFVVPSKLNSFQTESLRLIGVPPAQFELYDGKQVWELETQYFSPPTTWSGYDLPAADFWLRDKIFASCGIVSPKPTRRIFISRTHAQHRRILNEQPLLSFLEPLRFQKYLLEELSFREQVELFSQAEIVVSQHGAGLTNVLFSPPGCLVVELFAPAHFKLGYWCYWMTSKTMGHDYWYVLCEGVPNPSAPPNCDDLILPIEKLDRTLKSASPNLS